MEPTQSEGTASQHAPPSGTGAPDASSHADENFFIIVNRRNFTAAQGAKKRMTGREIAGLVDIPADNAVVRRISQPQGEIGIDETINVHHGEELRVTRKHVDGGHRG